MRIDIWSDFACPFCYIGKRNLEIALKELDLLGEVDIVFCSFQLDPHAEKSSQSDPVTSLSEKYGTTKEEAQRMIDRIVRMASDVGLEYDYENMIQTNTLDAHRLVHYGQKLGRDKEIMERLFKAHFIDGLDIGDISVLGDLSQEVGLDRQEVLNMLNSEEYIDRVEDDRRLSQQLGISSVPFFVIDNKVAVPGAQPPETFIQVLKEAKEES